MTVFEIFKEVNLSPCGPVRWKEQVDCQKTGVYVVAQVSDSNDGCRACALRFNDTLLSGLEIDIGYERQRWLPNEPILYIGKTDETIHDRVGAFYRHRCGNPSPHAGGQVVHLLACELWVYWSPSPNPYDTEQTMLCAFKKQVGQVPFANRNGRREKRIRMISN